MISARVAWKQIVQQLLKPTGIRNGIRPVILESWRRSWEAGVKPEGEIELRRISVDELTLRCLKNHILLDVAIPAIDDFCHSLGCTKHVIYLTDAEGIVLHSQGTDAMMQGYGPWPGFDWSEGAMGTNGAGTALACDAPVAVIGPEHWQFPFHRASCLAAPIHASDRSLMGALDLSTRVSDCRLEQLDNIVALAHSIEADLLRQSQN